MVHDEFYLKIDISGSDPSNYDAQYWIKMYAEGVSTLNAGAVEPEGDGINTVALAIGLSVGGAALLGGGYWFWRRKQS